MFFNYSIYNYTLKGYDMMRKSGVIAMLSLAGFLAIGTPALSVDAAWETTDDGTIYTQEESPGYVTGLQTIGKYQYYFNSHGIMQTGVQKIKKKLYYFNEKGIMQKGWIRLKDGTRYYADSKGVLAANKWVGEYYFLSDAKMAVNQWIEGKWVGADGRYTGVMNYVGWVTDQGKTRYYTSNKKMVTGWLSLSGKTYYLDPSNGYLKKGWFTVGNNTYYASSKGVIQKNKWVSKKYLQSNGVMATGMTTVNSKTYMFGSDGLRQKGWIKYKSHYYYFESKNGVMQTQKWVGKRYVTEDGTRASGWLTIKNKTYYFKPSTGVRSTGWVILAGKRYYFSKKGVLQKGRWLSSERYYLDENGVMLTGLQTIGDDIYYFNTDTGVKLTKKKKTVNGKTYYFKKSTGKAARSQWVKLSSKYYYFKEDGSMAKNTWIDNYYVDSKGVRSEQTKQTGWTTVNNQKYYFNEDGNFLTGWQTINKVKYYFSSTGVMLTGIQTIGKHKYYFYSDGELATSLTIIVGANQYTINSKGVVTAEESLKVSDKTRGGQIVNFALQYVGNPYVYGGTSLTKGADCSGFVQTVFSNFGIKLLRVADDQMDGPSNAYIKSGYKAATVVDINSMAPGDLIFYGSKTYATHVAIYIGNGNIVHASNSQPYPKGGIKVSNYDYSTPVRVVRYWN